ncbi:exo 1,3/1,4-beta-D-glucan glucohydrolase [uncultured Shewanella sp.]|uniref:glycoside hydrolase family 3 protein n=1 Tax=uncultured Shewanella sp. TaxID=173975 RepID=UPI00262CFA7F|nr:exo 1,3/1,4-beta-D-glucan glucohydrolase [uncultured Shewanella sp.]
MIKPILWVSSLSVLMSCSTAVLDTNSKVSSEQYDLSIWPQQVAKANIDPALEAKVTQLVKGMSIEQKVAQMIQPEIRDITVNDMRRYGFGSYLNGGGAFPQNNKHASVEQWVDLAEAMYQASIDDSLDGSRIPTMWGTDAVHGHNNVIGATLFPHNIGLGAANNPELMKKIAQVTATEVMITGIDWVFAPTVATVRDDRWGRTYEGFSEDPDIVKRYASAIVTGLQGSLNDDFLTEDRVISTVKHFLGDGGTIKGDDQGNNIASEQVLFDVHAQGYVGGLSAGAQTVMASFNSWQNNKIHGSEYLLTQVLKEQMGFDGFVVGDWNGHGQIPGCDNTSCPQAIIAGLDVFMAPTKTWKPLLENTVAQVKSGIIPMARIDDAVSRILRVKLRANLFDKPSPAKRPLSGKTALIGSESHRMLAQQAVRESLVLLKNNHDLLPLSPKLSVLVAGDGANNIGKQAGGWSITWQGTNNQNKDFPSGSSIFDGLAEQIRAAGGRVELNEQGEFTQKPDVAIVVFGETPYAEGVGDRDHLAYQLETKRDLSLLRRLKAQGIPVVSVFISGRPMWVNAEINASDAFVAAWLPGTEGKAISDVLLTDAKGAIQSDFKGKLSFSWPNDPLQTVNKGDANYQPLFPYGYGLTYEQSHFLANTLNDTFDADMQLSQGTPLFMGKVMAPWKMLLISDGQKVPIQSNSQRLPGIGYRTIDDRVQEDAFRLTLDGSQQAGIKFVSAQGNKEDLSAVLTHPSVLTLIIKKDSEVTGPLYLSMDCQSKHNNQAPCRASIDIAQQLAQRQSGEWVNVSIDLQYFLDKGVELTDITSPFELVSPAPISLSIRDIQLTSGLLSQDVSSPVNLF